MPGSPAPWFTACARVGRDGRLLHAHERERQGGKPLQREPATLPTSPAASAAIREISGSGGATGDAANALAASSARDRAAA